MRAVVQRVSSARVISGGQIVGAIHEGLVVFVGISRLDGPGDVRYLADKVAGLRIFSDEAGKMNRAITETGGAALAVSQFTLYGDCRSGRRPSFDAAAAPETAAILYGDFVRALREAGVPVETGLFQAQMSVELANDGPVTILLDSARQF
jgi:D-tyrosyl-tRNA(Tyr) deacylase